jgi:hypothetical protein
MINNLGHFTFNHTIYNKPTRHRRNLHVPQSHLAKRQTGVYYMSVKLFNSLPNYLLDLVHDKNSYKKINDILIHNPSDTVDKFLLLCQDLQLRNRNGMHTA